MPADPVGVELSCRREHADPEGVADLEHDGLAAHLEDLAAGGRGLLAGPSGAVLDVAIRHPGAVEQGPDTGCDLRGADTGL